jgi:preprotein translocase subunit SecD
VGRQLAVTIDGRVYTYPYVNERIDGGKCSIACMGLAESELRTTVAMLNGGMLPATVKITREWRE